MRKVRIGNRWVGDGEPCAFICEAGINCNGSVHIAKSLADIARGAGCEFFKLQKRTIDICYTKEELDKPRESPFGMTNRELKEALEFNKEQYAEIFAYCRKIGLYPFASCWDIPSVDFVEQFDPAVYKIASASLTDIELLRHHKRLGKPVILSTGMSTLEEVDKAWEILGTENLIILHAVSTYPSESCEVNLRVMETLRSRYGAVVGYSGHERGIQLSIAAACMGACMIERHCTTDRSMFGSDQSSSLEGEGIYRLVRDVREIEKAMGSHEKRVQERELPIKAKLRRVG